MILNGKWKILVCRVYCNILSSVLWTAVCRDGSSCIWNRPYNRRNYHDFNWPRGRNRPDGICIWPRVWCAHQPGSHHSHAGNKKNWNQRRNRIYSISDNRRNNCRILAKNYLARTWGQG